MATPQDILTIRSAANLAHSRAKLVLTSVSAEDAEVQRDDCLEKANAVVSVINSCEDQIEDFRRQKRALDDKMADVKSVQREFDCLKADLNLDAKRLNSHFWDLKKGRTIHDPKAESNS